MYKRITAILVFLLLFCGLSAQSIAVESPIENGDFESNSLLWSQGAFSKDTPHFGTHCVAFSSPVETNETGVLHSTSYLPKLSLLANTVYSLRFYIRINDSDKAGILPECRVIMPTTEKSITVYVSHISDSWQQISGCFMVDKTDAYDLTLLAESSSESATVYIDDIEITPISFTPVKMDIQGRRNVIIPESGETAYAYTPTVIDASGNTVSLRRPALSVTGQIPDGVSFNEERGELLVSAFAAENTTIHLLCTPLTDGTSLDPVSAEIHLSKNLLINGTFEDRPLYSGWDVENTPFSLCKEEQNLYAQIQTAYVDNSMYSGFLTPSQSFVLYASHMYVFRANLRSEASFDTRQIQAQVLSPNENGIIHIQTSNVGGSMWSEVVTAFYVPADGIYRIQFDFLVPDERPVYVDSIKIQPETPMPSGVYFETPIHVTIPTQGQVDIPLFYTVYDQEGASCNKNVQFSVYPENEGIWITESTLSILPSVSPDVYTVKAQLVENSSVRSYQTVYISSESVGDGSFETSAPGQWWTTAEPSLLHYISTYNNSYPSDGGLFARLTMNGAVSALLSDSIYRYENTQSYVFEADMKITVPDIETVVTVLVDSVSSDSFDDNLVVGQFTLSSSMQHIQKLFTPSEEITGRLMIAFNTPQAHDQQIILMDDISIAPATVYVTGVNISGVPYLDKNIIGKYRFDSNFGAIDSSTCRWLFSSTKDGIFMPIEGQTGNTLSITSDMIGKYVKFEVTPISLSGPVVGASAASAAIRVGEPIPVASSSSSASEITDDLNNVDDDDDISSSTPTKPTRNGMHVLELQKFTVLPRHQFWDLNQHWAKDEIELLTAAGVVQGRGNGLFEPQALITRAEFSAFLARAFELAPIFYEGQFDDVKYYNWYSGAVAVVTKYGIAQGTSETSFSPELPITREEMAVMIMRAYRKTGALTKESILNYTDTSNISTWALQDVGESNSLGLLHGLPDGSFQPKQNATRAEAAVTIKRMLTILSESN